jgi:DNA invertase Pin-like site-specific DNA recombinase
MQKNEKSKKRKIVVHYTRNSTRLQVINKTHEVHLEKIRSYTEQNNFNCVKEFVDKGISGTKKERKQLNALRNYIRLHEVDYVIVTKLDRIMRNFMEFNDLYKELIHYEVGLIAIEQSTLDLANWKDPMVKIFVTFTGLAAELEADWIADRREAGKKFAEIYGTKSGKPMHRPKITLPDEKIIKEWTQQREWRNSQKKPSVQFFADKYDCSWKTMDNKIRELGLK